MCPGDASQDIMANGVIKKEERGNPEDNEVDDVAISEEEEDDEDDGEMTGESYREDQDEESNNFCTDASASSPKPKRKKCNYIILRFIIFCIIYVHGPSFTVIYLVHLDLNFE